MKNVFLAISVCFLIVSCSSSFQGFYNNHKADMGTTSFQVPNFFKAVLSNISPEVKSAIGNITDFKFIKFETINDLKRQTLIKEMNDVTNSGYTDVFRKNELNQTRIISFKEVGAIVTDAIIFNSTETETTAYYFQGNLNPDKIKSFEDESIFNTFSNNLMQSYKTNVNPFFNPGN
ncbi:DUF4252 domain-containing protein [Thalassobellus sediminis]|uniref:DUF4252 domain-containing protein n=1 Tax=Thalassobellus sediminis TaxID=3367753 RepID=UPI00379FF9D9